MKHFSSGARLKEHAIASFTILIWGVTFLTTKALGASFSDLQILFLRYVIAYAVLWILWPHFLKFRSLREELLYFFAAALGTALYQFLENVSVRYTNPASVSFITALAPLLTAFLAYFILKEHFPVLPNVIGMLISLGGVFFISFGDAKAIETELYGDLIILGGIWLWALYSVLIKIAGGYGRPELAVTRRLFFYSLVVQFPFFLWELPTLDLSAFSSGSNIAGLLFLGIFASALCYYTWNRSVLRLGATVTSKYLFVMPVVTLVAQMIADRSFPGLEAFLGMALILIGLGVSNGFPRKRGQKGQQGEEK